VQRLDAQVVARNEEGLLVAVPDGEREHAAQVLDAILAPFFPGVDDGFGVGLRGEGVAERREFFRQLAEVVDLAVEDGDDRAVRVEQRLLAGGQVDDRQAAVAEADAGFQVDVALDRTAVELGLIHAFEGGALEIAPAARVKNANYSAHG